MKTSVGLKMAVRAAVATWAATSSLSASALGLGEIDMKSFLNEPLQAEVELLDTRDLTDEDIRIRLAGVEDFDRLGVDRSYFLTSIQFEVDVDPATGRGKIILTTPEAVLEPYLDVIIEARWPSGRLLREYTVLVDPPAFRQEVITVSASERVKAEAPDKPAVEGSLAAPGAVSRTETSRSGDSVAMRESSLPPGAMPQRDFSAETADQPRAGNRYMVKRDETLWQIASRGKPREISVQQAMLDIQRLNPEAFINGNINQIKAGYIIYLPAAGEVSSDDLAQALDEVRAQNREFQAARGAPGVTAAATLRVSADPVVRETAEPGDPVASTDAPVDRMTPDAAAPAPEAETPAARDADSVAPAGSDTASAELAAQLNAMADRLDTLEQIVALKDEQIATLEQALREAREAAAAAPPVSAPAQAPAVKPAPATPVSTAKDDGGLPWLAIGGGLLVLLLGGGFVLLRRRQAAEDDDDDGRSAVPVVEPDDDVFAGVSLKSDELDAPEAVAAVAASAKEAPAGGEPSESDEQAPPEVDDHGRGGSRGYGERKHDDYIDEGAAGDALAEADIYIAYGRYLQAIELLNTAIDSDPGNGAYRVKLIELYVDMGENDNAEAQLDELRRHGDDAAIARGEALLGGGSADVFDLDDTAAGAVGETSDDELEELSLTDSLDLELHEEPPVPAAEAAPVAEPGDSLELELGIEDAQTADLMEAQEAEEDIGEIEFDHLEIEDDVAPEAHEDLLDVGGASDELDLSEALMTEGEKLVEETAGEGEDLLIADDADQMATKLDLARAYIDMGDGDGARTILEEVADKGTPEQVQEASELLGRIG